MNENTKDMVTEHQINDYVIYRKNGICKIVDIRTENFGDMGPNLYYVMQTVYDENSIIYVPVTSKDLEQNMRRLLTVEEIHDIIDEFVESDKCWIDDSKTRVASFTKTLNQGDRAEILWIVKALTTHKSDLETQKKKLSVSDTKILTAAQKLINEEFSFVLGIPQEEVISYIKKRIDKILKGDTPQYVERDRA